MLENEIIKGIYISRYVASWCKFRTLKINDDGVLFRKWLKNLIIDGEHLTDEEIKRIWHFASTGKLELQLDAEVFIEQNKPKFGDEFNVI